MSAVDTRRVLHCDMDCFYAAVHVRDDPSLRGKPVIIGGSPQGRGVVAACSYEAREFGIHSAMPAARAVRLCHDAIFIKPDFSRYKAESKSIFEIYRQFTAVIQPVSIDEAYLDVTDCLAEWGSATALAEAVRQRVRKERGLTVSIGVGPNKLIAKIASDFGKPDGLTVVAPHRLQQFLDPLPVRRLPGVGPATEKRIKKLGIETISELRAMPLDRLEQRFGKHGKWLYACARGRDERSVREHRIRKSLSHERTYAEDLQNLTEMDAELERLGQRVSEDLKKREMAGRTLTIKVRFGDFTTLSRSHTLAGPTSEAGVITGWAKKLLRTTEAGARSVRLLGVGVSNLTRGELGQLELF